MSILMRTIFTGIKWTRFGVAERIPGAVKKWNRSALWLSVCVGSEAELICNRSPARTVKCQNCWFLQT